MGDMGVVVELWLVVQAYSDTHSYTLDVIILMMTS